MKYRNSRLGEPLSILGFGCMRFTRKGNGIDIPKAEKEIMRAIELGVNYFDTAYIYPGSEAALGEILQRNHVRDRVNIATKLPQYLIKKPGSIEKYFQEELSRLRTDHIDYYLMHMLTDIEAWNKLKSLGIEKWIEEKKKSGAIRQIGFSFHGNTEMFLQILNAYDWDFCQIQYNYMDEYSQAGAPGLQAAGAKGIPVIIMEPLRGGKLVDLLPPKAKALIRMDGQGRTPAQLAFRWLWDQSDVTVVLSGMNSAQMVEENCKTASEIEPGDLTEKEHRVINKVRDLIGEKLKVGCTGCGYCMPCPQGVDIPGAFRCYNEMYTENKRTGRWEYVQVVGMRQEKSFPSQCIGCGRCERYCPQHISIIQELKNADKALRPLHYRIVNGVMRAYVYRNGKKKKGKKNDKSGN